MTRMILLSSFVVVSTVVGVTSPWTLASLPLEVAEEVWDDVSHAQTLCNRRAGPTVIRGSFVHNMRAARWTEEILIREAKSLITVREQKNEMKFVYTSELGRLKMTDRWKLLKKATVREMTMQTLFRPKEGIHRYVSLHIENILSKEMWDDFPSRSLFCQTQHNSTIPPATHVWVGSGGTITAAHYDATHNFYLQVIGTKEFLLFPPSEMNELFFLPWKSALSRQSALDIPELFNVTLNRPLSYAKVVLAPGEMLYLPPWWSHRVSSPSGVSVSVNAWSDIDDVALLDASVAGMPLPMEDTWSWRRKVHGLALWMKLLSSMVDCCANAQESLLRRYQLMDQDDDGEQGCAVAEDIVFDNDDEEAIDEEQFARNATAIANVFSRMGIGDPYREDIVCMQLQNYFERVAHILFDNCTRAMMIRALTN